MSQLIAVAIERTRPGTPVMLRPSCDGLARFFQLSKQLASELPALVILGPSAAGEITEEALQATRITIGAVPVVALFVERLPLASFDAVYEFQPGWESVKGVMSELLEGWLKRSF